MKQAVLTLLLLASISASATKPIPCSIHKAAADDPTPLVVECPGRDIYTPLRALLYITDTMPEVGGGKVCQLRADGEGDTRVEFVDITGIKREQKIHIKSILLRNEGK